MKETFESLVEGVKNYVVGNDLKCMVLGVSGGIDSTVVAAICSEVSKQVEIPLIGRSLTIKNAAIEISSSSLVGNAFCDDFKHCELSSAYLSFLKMISKEETGEINDAANFTAVESLMPYQTKIANGNIQARLRMIYLYNLAGIHQGVVMDTDNLTEHYLGFFTIHGDDGDLNPLTGLWKTDVYNLAEYLVEKYTESGEEEKVVALRRSIALIPTDGNGVSNGDLEQIGGKSYYEVDSVLKSIVHPELYKYPTELEELMYKVKERYERSHFKRAERPVKIVAKRDHNCEEGDVCKGSYCTDIEGDCNE